jgi:hypothetical protein
MTAKQVEQIVHKDPFQPYRLMLSNGEEIVVRRPRKSHVSGRHVACVGECRSNGGPTVERFRMIDVANIVSAELTNLPPRA